MLPHAGVVLACRTSDIPRAPLSAHKPAEIKRVAAKSVSCPPLEQELRRFFSDYGETEHAVEPLRRPIVGE